jgi:hypothetical protein
LAALVGSEEVNMLEGIDTGSFHSAITALVEHAKVLEARVEALEAAEAPKAAAAAKKVEVKAKKVAAEVKADAEAAVKAVEDEIEGKP